MLHAPSLIAPVLHDVHTAGLFYQLIGGAVKASRAQDIAPHPVDLGLFRIGHGRGYIGDFLLIFGHDVHDPGSAALISNDPAEDLSLPVQIRCAVDKYAVGGNGKVLFNGAGHIIVPVH